jgi:hypothetical protein
LAILASAQAQPTISSVFPNGTYLLQGTNQFSFVATAPAGVTSVAVTLNGTKMSGAAILASYSTANGGVTVSNGTNYSCPLLLDVEYSATITATDGNGKQSTASVSFDTLSAYTWEAEDYNYGGGKYFDNPQTNAYAGLAGIPDTDDEVAGKPSYAGWAYRPEAPDSSGNENWPTEKTGDVTRAPYLGTGETDYDLSWNGAGQWANYTRHYPAGHWNIWVRGSGINGGTSPGLEWYQGAVGGTDLGHVNFPNRGGWQNYGWEPLVDGSGNPVEWDTDGTAQTLALYEWGGNFNLNFFMLLPATTNTVPDAVILPIFPNGTYQNQATNTMLFAITSTLGVNPANVVVQLVATNIYSGQVSNLVLTSGSGLTISGPATNLQVTASSLITNLIYHAAIAVTDANGNQAATNFLFDTVRPSYTWEAEDYDYTNGMYIDNPQTNGYGGLTSDVGVDCFYATPSIYGAWSYRPETTDASGDANPAQEANGDVPRQPYIGTGLTDYSMSFNAAGNWANYTRHYPAGKWNIFIRSSGNPAGVDSAVLYQGGLNGKKLGQFNIPNTGGWENYTWVPLVDSAGNLVEWDASGSAQTLTMDELNGNFNPNYFMLMPVNPNYSPVPVINNLFPDGAYQLQATNSLSFNATSPQGISQTSIQVQLVATNLLGQGFSSILTAANGLTISGVATNLLVTAPLNTNFIYKAFIQVASVAGTQLTVTNGFDTVAPSYTWETEDYDYNSGLYIDNPQTNGYAGLTSVVGVDCLYTNPSPFASWPYRSETTDASGDANPPQEANGDVTRRPYIGTGLTDYSLSFNATGTWANYTRHYPAGKWNIYLRSSGYNPYGTYNGTNSAVIYQGAASGKLIGQFNIPGTGAWETYTWTPLVDGAGNIVEWDADGTQQTLQLFELSANFNPNYFMLVPIPAHPTLNRSLNSSTGVLSLAWPTAPGWVLQAQTNGLAAGLGKNWVSITDGSVTSTNITVDRTQGAVFYRLMHP